MGTNMTQKNKYIYVDDVRGGSKTSGAHRTIEQRANFTRAMC